MSRWSDFEKATRNFVRVWWRPVTCIGIAGGVVVNGVVMPLVRWEPIDLTGWAAVIASCATVFAIREWGKINGAD